MHTREFSVFLPSNLIDIFQLNITEKFYVKNTNVFQIS